MRKLVLLPLIALVPACSDRSLVEPPGEPELDVVAATSPAGAAQYAFQVTRDWTCGPVEGCLPGETYTTPSGVLHIRNLKARFLATGGLTGELWITGDFTINLSNGKGIGNGVVHFILTEPAVGTFQCQAHADYEEYNPPLFAYVEHARYSSCRGAQGFDGKQMVVWLNNEANPGVPIVDGTAEIW